MIGSRRHFLRQSMLAGTALTASTALSLEHAYGADATALGKIPIIDTHQHLWDLDVFRPPWLMNAQPVLKQAHVTEDYQKATRGLNVIKAVYMEIDVEPGQQLQEAQHAIQLCRSTEHPTAAAVISGRPASPAFDAYITRFQDSPYIKGVRQVLHAASARRGLCLDPQFVSSMRRLGELNMSFDLCMRPSELDDGRQLATLCPETRFIVDHCGNADPKAFMKRRAASEDAPSHDVNAWQRDIAKLADLPNVACKISGIVASAPDDWTADHLAPIVNHCLDSFGPERVMFGSDWPVCRLQSSYRQWVEALWEIVASRSDSARRALFSENATRLYRLS